MTTSHSVLHPAPLLLPPQLHEPVKELSLLHCVDALRAGADSPSVCSGAQKLTSGEWVTRERNGCMGGWVDEWRGEGMDRRMDGDGWVNGWLSGQVDEWTNGQRDG